jgi:glycosyltransferase 2 family protein
LRLALQAALTATLLAALAAFADWPGMASALRRADLGPVLAALAVSLLGVLLSAAKWRLLLRRVDITLPFREAARLYWVGMFASNFLPTSVGGDAVRLALTPARDRLALVAGSILVERLTGFMVMLALCALGLALGPWRLPRGLGWLAAAVPVGLAIAGAALLLAPAPVERLLAGLAVRLPPRAGRAASAARKVATGMARHARDPAGLAAAVLLSLPFYGTVALAQWLALRAVGSGIGLGEAALVAPLVQLLGVVPLTPNGLVVVEAGFVLLYGAAGVPPGAALAAAVLRRLVDLANSGLGAPAWWLGRPVDAHAAPCS